jgi:hypothetical protein
VYGEQQFLRLCWHARIMGKTSAKRNGEQKSTLTERDRRTLRRVVWKNQNYCSRTEYSSWRPYFHGVSFTNPTSRVGLQLRNLWLLKECSHQLRKRWCHDHKTWTSDNWKRARDMVRWAVLHAVPYIRNSLCLENTQGNLQSGMPGSNSKTQRWFCDGLGSSIAVQCIGLIITLHGRITAR